MAYTESNDPVVTARAVADLQRLQAAGINNTDEGKNVYDDIANDPNLTGRQKQAICCELGKAIVAQGITDAGAHPTTLLRQSSASTRFMSAYMEDSASRFFNAVKEKAADVGRQNVQAPPANPGDAVSYDDAAAPGATRALLTALDTEKHKLSADACEFMQACSAGIPGHIVDGERQDVENTLAVNTLLLRGVMPLITVETAAHRANNNASDTSRNRAAMAFEANRSAMKFLAGQLDGFANPFGNSPAATALAGDVAFRQQMQQMTDLLATGDHTQLQVGAPVSVKDSLKQALGKDDASKLAQAQAKLGSRQQKLNTLLDQRDAGQQTSNLKVQSLAVNATTGNATNAQIQKGIQTVREMQEAARKLGEKIQNQEQKVERSEQRVDSLMTRIGRR